MTEEINGAHMGISSNEPKRQMSREERRRNEKIGEDAKAIFESIANKFMDAFTLSDDPEGPGIAEFGVQLSKQWRTYCKRKGLVTQLYGAVDAYVKSVHEDYAKIDEPIPAPGEQPEPTPGYAGEPE